MLEHVSLLVFKELVHIEKEVMLLSNLFMKLKVINHLLNTMDAEIIKANASGYWSPFKIEEGIRRGNLQPVP